MRDYELESDLKQDKFQSLKLAQGDKGNKIKINVFEDGQPVNLTGCSITAKYKRSDGKVINGTVENISDNSFDAVMNSDITKVAGTLKMIFAIEKDDVKVSTFLLLADVKEGIGESTGSSTGEDTGGSSGEVTVDLSEYYKKSETYSKAQIDLKLEDIPSEVSTQVDNIIKNKFSNKKTVVTSLNLLNTTQFENLSMSDLLNKYNSGELLIDVIPDAFTVGQAYNTEVMFTDGTSYASGDFFFQFLKDTTVLFSRYTFNLSDLPNKAKLIFNKTNMLNSYSDKVIKYIQVCKKASGEAYPTYSKYTEEVLFDEFVTKSDINKLSLENISSFLLPSKTRIIGHRGGTSYPENSLLSFEEGCKLGYDFIETDIWQTSDGELVCMHDQDVSRTTDGTGDIMTMTLEQVKALNIDLSSDYANLKVPTFKEYLFICKKYGKVPVIEIKNINQDWDKLTSDLTDCNMQNSAIILSTSIDYLKQIREKLPQVHCSYLLYSTASITTSILEELQEMKNTSIDTNIELTEEIVKQCHEYDVLIGMWTIDDVDKANTLISYGVDFITTNTSKLINTNTSASDTGTGGSEREWKLLKDLTLTETVNAITEIFDNDYKEILIIAKGKAGGTSNCGMAITSYSENQASGVDLVLSPTVWQMNEERTFSIYICAENPILFLIWKRCNNPSVSSDGGTYNSANWNDKKGINKLYFRYGSFAQGNNYKIYGR